MVKFNPENKKNLTYSEIVKHVFKINDKIEAKNYLIDYILYLIHNNNYSIHYAEKIAKMNILYYLSHFNLNDIQKIEKYFDININKIKVLRKEKLKKINLSNGIHGTKNG